MKRRFSFVIGLFLVLWLAGCASTGGSGAAVEGRAPDGSVTGDGASASGARMGGDMSREAIGGYPPGQLPDRRTVYFEFDSAQVTAEDQQLVAAHGAYLAMHAGMSVSVEGHADERGSREYNIGLGDRRAQAVRRLLELQGVSARQVRTVSYGEEKPVASGHHEAAWQQNRRVELVYSGN